MAKHPPNYDFALRVAAAIDDLKSSHVYFVMQKAFGETLDWSDVQKKLNEVIESCKCRTCMKTIRQVRRNFKG